MTALWISLLALACGPVLVHFAKRLPAAVVALDAFVVVVIGGLLLLHVLPESIATGGLGAIVAAGIGLLLPSLIERGMSPSAGRARTLLIIAATIGFFLHTALDGAALAHGGHDHAASGPGHSHDHGLLVGAVLAHRIPVGLAIWWVLPRTLGMAMAVGTMLLAIAGTVLGFLIGDHVLSGATAWTASLFQALMCGSLLHVVLHAHIPQPRDRQGLHLASVLGAVAAGLSIWFATQGHDHAPAREPNGEAAASSGTVFLNLVLESAPALLIAYLLVGIAESFLPTGWLARITSGNRLIQALRGVAIGIPLPVCSCGVVPIYRQLVVKGSGVAAAIAFLVATPELEIAAIFLTFQLLGFEVAVARLGAAAILAVVVALVVARFAPPPTETDDSTEPVDAASHSLSLRMREALRYGFTEAVDNTAPWILLGLGLASLLVPYLDPATLGGLPAGVGVPLAALLGMPLYVCASGSTPLAAVLVAGGLSPGAAVAFLLTGPATNVTTFGVLRRLHSPRTATAFAIAMVIGATALGYAIDFWLANAPAAASTTSALHASHPASTVQIGSAIALAALVAWSLLRNGTREFIDQLFVVPTASHDHHHGHGHHHDHGHDESEGSCCSH